MTEGENPAEAAAIQGSKGSPLEDEELLEEEELDVEELELDDVLELNDVLELDDVAELDDDVELEDVLELDDVGAWSPPQPINPKHNRMVKPLRRILECVMALVSQKSKENLAEF